MQKIIDLLYYLLYNNKNFKIIGAKIMNAKDIFVIDFNSQFISFCHALANNNGVIKINKLITKDYSGFINGEFLEKEEVGILIRKGLEELNVKYSKITNLYIGVPAHFSNTVCKNVTRNFAERKVITEQDIYSLYDIAENFSHENQTVINRSGISYTLDNGEYVLNPIGKLSQSLSSLVSIVVADNYFIKTISANLPVLNIQTPQFISSNLCQMLYLLSETERQDNAIILDLGYINSSVSYISQDGILGLRSFGVGGGHIIGDISNAFKISFSSAQNVINNISVEYPANKLDVIYTQTKDGERPISVEMAQEIVFAKLNEIVSIVNHCINSLNAVIPTYSPIYLTGECAEMIKGLAQCLQKLFKRNVKTLVPSVPKYEKTVYSSLISIISVANQEEKCATKTIWQKIFGKW